jgi:tetratricopeptide (TPR) repeat protein
MSQPSRNSPCPCGSGKKYKRCCGAKQQQIPASLPSKTMALRRLVESALDCQERGELASAIKYLDDALEISPKDSGLLGLKGMLAHQCGRNEEAVMLIQKGLAVNPNDSRLHNFLGQAFAASSDYVAAERSFGRAVTLDPDFIEAWSNLAHAQMQRHQPEAAIPSLEQVIRLAPGDSDALLRLAQAYYLTRNLVQATETLNRAANAGASNVLVELWSSLILRDQDRDDEAKVLEHRALERLSKDEQASVCVEFGQIASHVGNLKEAERWLLQAIELRPDVASPYVDLATAIKFTDHDLPVVAKMESILPGIQPENNKRSLEFALGKVWTDIGDYRRSFEHYQAANQIVRQNTPFNADEHVKQTDHLIDYFSAERLASLPAGSDSHLPILIVGTPRSGTTLTEQIISSHSLVGAAGEMDFWPRLASSLEKNYSGALAKELAKQYLAHMREHSATAIRVTDKMPANFRNLGVIHAALPNAKIIHCRRHPIDACLSIFLMEHWRSVLPKGTMFEFDYEQLVEDTEKVSRQMMDFLGLEWEPGQLEFYKQDRAVFTASKWQARQPIYKTSKERWRSYEEFIKPLLPLLKYARSG